MAFVRSYSTSNAAANSTSHEGELPLNIENGDALLWLVCKDSTSGFFNTLPSPWVQVATSIKYASTSYIAWIYPDVDIATIAAPTISSTDSDTWSTVMISLGGVASSYSDIFDAFTSSNLGNAIDQDLPTITTSEDNCLQIFVYADSGTGGVLMGPGLIPISESPGISESIYCSQRTQKTAGTSPVFKKFSGLNNSAIASVISIKDGSSGSDVEAEINDPVEIFNNFQGPESATWRPNNNPLPTGIVAKAGDNISATINGYTFDDAPLANVKDVSDAGSTLYLKAAGFTVQRSASHFSGVTFDLDITEGLATYDLTDSDECLIWCNNFLSELRSVFVSSIEDFGQAIALHDDNNNYSVWTISGTGSERQVYSPFQGSSFLHLDNTDTIHEQGTLDKTKIQKISFLCRGQTGTVLNNISCLMKLKKQTAYGSGSGKPINLGFLKNMGESMFHTLTRTIGNSSELYVFAQLGDGSEETHVDLSNKVLIFPKSGPTNATQMVDGFFGFELNPSASCVFDFSGSTLTSETNYRLKQLSGSTGVNFSNCSLKKANPLIIDTGDYTATSWDDCQTITQNGADLENATIKSPQGGTALIIDSSSAVFTDSNTLKGLTIDAATNGIQVDSGTSLTLNDVTFTNVTNKVVYNGTGTLTINLAGSTSLSTGDVSTPNGGTVTLQQTVPISTNTLTDGTRIMVENIQDPNNIVELVNTSVTAGGALNFQLDMTSGVATVGDTLRIKAAVIDKLELESVGTLTSTGLNFILTFEDDTVYAAYGHDGATLTPFDFDIINTEIDVVIAQNFYASQAYSRYKYIITTADGIRVFFKALKALDAANIENDVTRADLFLTNDTTSNLTQIDNIRLFKSNGIYPVRDYVGKGGLDIVWRDKIFIADLDTVKANQTIINNGIKKASLFIPHTDDVS